MDIVKALKIGVAFVHDVESASFENNMVEKMNIVYLAACNTDKCRNIAPQI